MPDPSGLAPLIRGLAQSPGETMSLAEMMRDMGRRREGSQYGPGFAEWAAEQTGIPAPTTPGGRILENVGRDILPAAVMGGPVSSAAGLAGLGAEIGLSTLGSGASRSVEELGGGGIAQMAADIVASSSPGALGAKAAGAASKAAIFPWHGTPNKWGINPETGRVSPWWDKMGTGEGAQAFTKGHYSADRKGIAESYWDGLQDPERVPMTLFDGEPWENVVWDIGPRGTVIDGQEYDADVHEILSLVHDNGSVDTVKNYFKERVARKGYDQHEALVNLTWLEDNADRISLPEEYALTGGIYGLIHDVNPEDLIDLDLPMSQQSPKVREALAEIPEFKGRAANLDEELERMTTEEIADMLSSIDRNGDFGQEFEGELLDPDEWRSNLLEIAAEMESDGDSLSDYLFGGMGGDASAQSMQGLYKQLSMRVGGDTAASELLRDAGVPGAQFLDGMSRGTAGQPEIHIGGKPLKKIANEGRAQSFTGMHLARAKGDVTAARKSMRKSLSELRNAGDASKWTDLEGEMFGLLDEWEAAGIEMADRNVTRNYVMYRDDLTYVDPRRTDERLFKDVEIGEPFRTVDPKRWGDLPEIEDPMVVQHNLSQENLLHADKIGGLAMPSMAIVKADQPLKGYGDVSLIGPPELAKPSRSNPVFSADAYTPTYPPIHTNLKSKEVGAVYKSLMEPWGGDYSKIRDSTHRPYVHPDLSDLDVDRFLDGDAARARYLHERGMLPDTKGGEVPADQWSGQVSDLISKNQADFDQWKAGYFDSMGITPKRQIFRGYTDKGNRRYADETIDNVVREMKQEMRGAEGSASTFGAGVLRAHVAPQFRTMKQVKAARDKIKGPEDVKVFKEAVNDKFAELGGRFAEYSNTSDPNPFIHQARAVDNMVDVLSGRGRWDEWFDGVPADLKQEVNEFATLLREGPTGYFEMKPKRGVGLDEFRVAAVPLKADKKVVETLQKHGIRVERYATDAERDLIISRSRDQFFSWIGAALLGGGVAAGSASVSDPVTPGGEL